MDFTTKEMLKRYAKLAIGQPFAPIVPLQNQKLRLLLTFPFFKSDRVQLTKHRSLFKKQTGNSSRLTQMLNKLFDLFDV